MIAQRIYHSVGRIRSRGRKLRFQFFEAQADCQGQGLSENKSGAGLKVKAGTISPSAKGRICTGVQSCQSGMIVLFVIGIEFEPEPDSIAAERQPIVFQLDAGKTFSQRVAVGESAHCDGIRADGRGGLADSGPALI